MEHNDYKTSELWEDGAYGNGRTRPPKQHSGGMALLLILVIFLLGIISVLSILNIRLFRQLRAAREAENAISFSAQKPLTESIPLPTVPVGRVGEDFRMELEDAVLGADTLPQGSCLPLQELFAQNRPSLVALEARSDFGAFSGSGVIVSDDGYLVTNAHLVSDATQISVLLSDGRVFSARLVGVHDPTDLAVLHIDGENLPAARFGSSSMLRVGDSVVAMGNPLGTELGCTMTDGILTAICDNVVSAGRSMTLLQTNATLNPGNSGGPLIDCYGRVVGIVSGELGASISGNAVGGLGFAVPSDTVVTVVEQLIEQGYVSGRPTLGLVGEALDVFYQHYYQMPAGLYLTAVYAQGPAAAAGLEVGDILVSLDGTVVGSMGDLSAFLSGCDLGQALEVSYYRSGVMAVTTIIVGESPG